jgi:O-antigen/teichoic acid export membrane protein
LVIISFGIAVAYFENAEALFAMLWMMAIGITLIALMQLSIVIVTAKRVGDKISHRASEAKRWWRFAVPWVIIAVANDFFFDIDIIILSSFLEPHELAIFGVISRVFVLISFGVVAVYAVSVPDMFESEANNDRSAFLQKVGDANLVAAALSLAMVIGVTIFGGYVLSIFGPDFVAGHMPLVILSVALLVRSIFGPAALVLSIYDKPYASLPSVIIGLFSLVSLNYYLVPSYSLMGAAIAALISIAIWSIAQWFTALKLAKVDISIFAAIKHHLPLILKAQ